MAIKASANARHVAMGCAITPSRVIQSFAPGIVRTRRLVGIGVGMGFATPSRRAR